MKLDKKEMKMRYETTPVSVENKVSVENAFDFLFEEILKLIKEERTVQYA